jgi:hypothetical protein
LSGLAQQRSHLSLELPFAFEHALMAHAGTKLSSDNLVEAPINLIDI